MQAAVHEGAEQLASGNEAVVRKGSQLEDCFSELMEEVRVSH